MFPAQRRIPSAAKVSEPGCLGKGAVPAFPAPSGSTRSLYSSISLRPPALAQNGWLLSRQETEARWEWRVAFLREIFFYCSGARWELLGGGAGRGRYGQLGPF